MKDFLPLFQALIWPIFVVGVIFWCRKRLSSFLKTIEDRVKSGDDFSAGPDGVKLARSAADIAAESEATSTPQHNPGYYVIHKAHRDGLNSKGQEYYEITIFLVADPGVPLSSVKRVMYHLHSTYTNPDRVVTDADTSFRLRTHAWGQFNLLADVYLEDCTEPLRLQRYLNF